MNLNMRVREITFDQLMVFADISRGETCLIQEIDSEIQRRINLLNDNEMLCVHIRRHGYSRISTGDNITFSPPWGSDRDGWMMLAEKAARRITNFKSKGTT